MEVSRVSGPFDSDPSVLERAGLSAADDGGDLLLTSSSKLASTVHGAEGQERAPWVAELLAASGEARAVPAALDWVLVSP